MKDKNLNFKTSKKEADEFNRVAEKIDIPFSQLAREAIREKIAVLKKTDPRLQEEPETVAA